MPSIKIRCQTSHSVSLPLNEELLQGEHSRLPSGQWGKPQLRAADQGREGQRPAPETRLGRRGSTGPARRESQEEGGPKHLLQFKGVPPPRVYNAEAALVSAAPLYRPGLSSTGGGRGGNGGHPTGRAPPKYMPPCLPGVCNLPCHFQGLQGASEGEGPMRIRVP